MDVQRSIKFDSKVHRLRSHPSERVRQAADKALKAKQAEGIDAAEAILAEVPELREKTLIDVMVDEMKVKNAGLAARYVRSGKVTVDGKIATNLRQVVHLGQKVLIENPKSANVEYTAV
jgi:hypothetical protein